MSNPLPRHADERRNGTSASNAHADQLCPGRHLTQLGLPDVAGEYSESGTRLHAALCVQDHNAANGLTLAEHAVFDACREMELTLSRQFFGESRLPMKVWREHRWFMPWDQTPVGPLVHSAKPDLVQRIGQKALIIEYKSLYGDVPESSRNLQLRDQACLVMANVPLLSEIGTVVIQPNVTRSPEICLYSKADLERAAQLMYERVKASNDPVSLRIPGDIQCHWCKAKAVCNEYSAWTASKLAPALLQNQLAEQVISKAIVDWTPEQRAIVAGMLAPAQKRLDEIRDALKEILSKDANGVPGFALQPGALKQRITDPQACFDRLAALGATLPQFMDCITVGKTKLKEVIHAVTKDTGRALDKRMAELTSGIVAQRQDEPSIVKVKAKVGNA